MRARPGLVDDLDLKLSRAELLRSSLREYYRKFIKHHRQDPTG